MRMIRTSSSYAHDREHAAHLYYQYYIAYVLSTARYIVIVV
jgi:hypothetical protein